MVAASDCIDTDLAAQVAEILIVRRQTVAISESSAEGLISAALLSVPGASAFFLGGGVIYTPQAREIMLGLTPLMTAGMRSTTGLMAHLLARSVRTRFGADWGLAETGTAGPSSNRYGGTPGHCCLAIVGPKEIGFELVTGKADRVANMQAFGNAALSLLRDALCLP